ncbi:MAG TPA: hypothetical protein VKS60_26020 [Stellaceae bacterium]|nr:hypothetical protein [Stellaceae bacterium]
MFQPWQNFYMLLGPAAGTLIGLLFVVVTLTSRIEHSRAQHGVALYMTPNLFQFGIVLLISATALAPGLMPNVSATIITACAAAGFVYASVIAVRMRSGRIAAPPHWSDIWCYAVTPAIVYLGLGASALASWTAPVEASYGIAVAATILLLVAIRNAWDLVTWLAPRRDGG